MTDLEAIRTFLDEEGRLTVWPSKRSLQQVAIQYLATQLDVGATFTEKEINALLNRWHTFGDPALMRRELFEAGLVNRSQDGSAYWRTPNTKLL